MRIRAPLLIVGLIGILTGCTTSGYDELGASSVVSAPAEIMEARPVAEPENQVDPAKASGDSFKSVFSMLGNSDNFEVGASGGAGVILLRQPRTDYDDDPQFLVHQAICTEIIGRKKAVPMKEVIKDQRLRPAYWPTCLSKKPLKNLYSDLNRHENWKSDQGRKSMCNILLGYYNYRKADELIDRIISDPQVRNSDRGPFLVAWSNSNSDRPLVINMSRTSPGAAPQMINYWLERLIMPTEEWSEGVESEVMRQRFIMWAPFILKAVANITSRGLAVVYEAALGSEDAMASTTDGRTRFEPATCE